MTDENLLKSKYERLCVEFKKLRNKHKQYKDLSTEELTTLKATNELQEKRIVELENECVRMRHDQTRWVKPEADCTPVSSSIGTNLSGSSHPSSPINISSPNRVGSSLQDIVLNLIEALGKWTEALNNKEQRFDCLDRADSALVSQISQLERQVCDLSVQCQMERKRRLLVMQTSQNGDPVMIESSTCPVSSVVDVINEQVTGENPLLDRLQQRIYTLVDEAQYSAALASFYRDEVLSISPYLATLSHEALFYQSECNRLTQVVQKLGQELETTTSSSLHQTNAMANHIVTLTDELEEVRGGTRKQMLDNAKSILTTASNTKNSLLSALKR